MTSDLHSGLVAEPSLTLFSARLTSRRSNKHSRSQRLITVTKALGHQITVPFERYQQAFAQKDADSERRLQAATCSNGTSSAPSSAIASFISAARQEQNTPSEAKIKTIKREIFPQYEGSERKAKSIRAERDSAAPFDRLFRDSAHPRTAQSETPRRPSDSKSASAAVTKTNKIESPASPDSSPTPVSHRKYVEPVHRRNTPSNHVEPFDYTQCDYTSFAQASNNSGYQNRGGGGQRGRGGRGGAARGGTFRTPFNPYRPERGRGGRGGRGGSGGGHNR